MIVSQSDWEFATGREVQRQGVWFSWRCTFHDDGANPSRWSCKGKEDGKFRCFACGAHGSIVDIIAIEHFGAARQIKKGDDKQTRYAYKQAFDLLESHGFSISKIEPRQQLRNFTQKEREFLTDVHALFHRQLIKDRKAKAYLESRGAGVIPIFGAARPWHLPELKEIAKKHGDEELLLSTGLVMHSKKDSGLYQVVRNMLVVVQLDEQGTVTYYQARRLYPSDRPAYYNPFGIKKRPITYNLDSEYRWAGEGFFKGAWLWTRGWGGGSLQDSNVAQWSPNDIRFLDNGLWFEDNEPAEKYNDEPPGAKAVRLLREIAQQGGYSFRSVKALWHKDIDTWAKSIGYELAENHLRRLIDHAQSEHETKDCSDPQKEQDPPACTTRGRIRSPRKIHLRPRTR